MKISFKYFALALALIAAVACSRENILPEPVMKSGAIMIDVAPNPHTKLTEADLASKGPESYVTHVDMYVFGEQAAEEGQTPANVYYERISYTDPSNPDRKALAIKKSMFKSDAVYDIYVIANTSKSEAEMSAVTTVSDIAALEQVDEDVYLTGLNLDNVPKAFLMDAMISGVVLNPSNHEAEDVVLEVALTRAAAKIVVELFEGSSDVSFQAPDNAHVYHFRNIPYSTSLIPSKYEPYVRSTDAEQTNAYVDWNVDNVGSLVISGNAATVTGKPQIAITGYLYAYDYAAKDMQKHTSLVINIPLKITTEGSEESYTSNYYKIPLSSTHKFERNKVYRIRANVNAPGAQTSFDEPFELSGLEYDVLAWNDDVPAITVGGVNNRPEYLQLNMDHVDIYNVNKSEGMLSFSSSSYISKITLKEAYYFNSTDTKISLNTSSNDLDRTVYGQIKATYPENTLNGGITINSPFVAEGSTKDSHGNTIRFMTFVVTNEDGLTKEFTVSQYPTLYITNEVGTYSYREDFSGDISGVSWSGGAWTYQANSSNGRFFSSKVAVANNNGNGYTIYYANWNSDGTSYSRGSSTGSSFVNPRMYHIHVTATSSDYIVAKPRLDASGYTESTEENSYLVSPSFFIASQLGATELNNSTSTIDIEKARRHCEQYIEVADGKEYKDWRLPTKAEIDIITNHQPRGDKASPAMAEVMNGSHYYCAYNPDYKNNTGTKANWLYTVRDIGSSNGMVHVRCVHDAY